MKRKSALWMGGMFMLLVLSGCGKPAKSGSHGAESDGKAVVDIFQNKSEVAQQLEDAARIYMDANPDVTINIETVQGNEYNTALKAKMLMVDAIDIMALGANDIANNYPEYLADLSDQPWVRNVPSGLLEEAKLNGKVVGLPVNIEGYGIVYNKAIFEAADIDGSALTTYEDIEKAFKKLQGKIESGGLGEQFPLLEAASEYAAKESWVIGLHTLNIALANEFASSKETLAAKTIDLKYSDQLKALYELLTDYTPAGKQKGQLLAVDYSTQVGGGLAIERVAAIQQGNWIGPDVKSIAPDVYKNLDFLPLPLKGIKEDSIAVGIPAYWSVNKNASDADQKAAKDFMNWLYQSEDGKQIVVNELGYIPAFGNYEGIEISDPLSASIMRYVSENRTMPWVFGGFPSGYEGRASSDIQAYIGGLKSWEECVGMLKDDWKELQNK